MSQSAVYADWLDGVAERTGKLPFPISYSSHDQVMFSPSLLVSKVDARLERPFAFLCRKIRIYSTVFSDAAKAVVTSHSGFIAPSS